MKRLFEVNGQYFDNKDGAPDINVKTALAGVAAFFDGEFHRIESVVPEARAKRPGGQLQTDECRPTFSHCYVHQDGGGLTGDDFHGTVYFHLGDAEYLAVGY